MIAKAVALGQRRVRVLVEFEDGTAFVGKVIGVHFGKEDEIEFLYEDELIIVRVDDIHRIVEVV